MTAGQLLRRARREAGLTQAELARRARTSQPAVARYETGSASPSVRTLERLLQAAGSRLVLGSESLATGADLTSHRMRRLRGSRAQLRRIVAKAGATSPRVFGSVARGEDGPDSDIDILVDFPVSDHGAMPLIRLRRDLSELLGEDVDLVATSLLTPEVRQRALDESVPL